MKSRTRTITLKAHQLERTLKAGLLNELGRSDRDRILALLPCFKEGRARISDCVSTAFPGKPVADAAKLFTNLRVAFNVAATHLQDRNPTAPSLRFEADSNKRTPIDERFCWFAGPDPAASELEKMTKEGTGDLPAHILGNRGVVLPLERILPNSRNPRVFVSYAHNDAGIAREWIEGLKTFVAAYGGDFQPQFLWSDHSLVGGDDWKREIREKMDSSLVGVFLVSADLLASDFIREEEIPHFVRNGKGVVPIRLRKIPAGHRPPLLETLRTYQMVERVARDRTVRSYEEDRQSPRNKPDFIGKSMEAVATALLRTLSANEPGVEAPPSTGAPSASRPRVHELAARFARPETDEFIPGSSCEMAADALARLSDSRDIPAGKPEEAIPRLMKWACDPNATPYFAVLGELGIGKTTTLKHFACTLLEARVKDPSIPLPIFIDLRLGETTRDGAKAPPLELLLDSVIRHHFKGGDAPDLTARDIIQAVREEGAVVIFDGLDEKMVHYDRRECGNFMRELWRILPPSTNALHPDNGHANTDNAQSPNDRIRTGKILFSCRTHFFADVVTQVSLLTGEDREGIDISHYQLLFLLPFNEAQIRSFLLKRLGSAEHAENAIRLFASIHNLTELSSRPLLLKLMAEQIGELERQQAAGTTIRGVTLYELLVQKWLTRDDGKHQFTLLDKTEMMEQIAADMFTEGGRDWPWERVERWLRDFLQKRPEIRSRYQGKSPEALNEDFRTATFVLRPDGSRESFRFAHSSIQEYFHARHLVKALEDSRWAAWEVATPSVATLDFAGQLMAMRPDPRHRQGLETLLTRGEPKSAKVAFRYWTLAIVNQLPQPQPDKPNLSGLDLDHWEIVGKSPTQPLVLNGATLSGARLDHARLRHVHLSGADLCDASFRLASFEDVDFSGASADAARFVGARFLECFAPGLRGATADWYDADWIRSDLTGANLGPEFGSRGTLVDCSIGGRDRATQPEIAQPDQRGGAGDLVPVSRDASHKIFDSCDWSPDGTRLLAASLDNLLRVWDSKSGRCLMTLEGHSKGVRCCAWSPDGTRLLSGSDDHTLRVWDARSGASLLTLEGHSEGVLACGWSPDGSRVVSGSLDKTLRIWEVTTGRCLAILEGHVAGVLSCAWSPDGTRLLSGSGDNTLRLWDATSGRCGAILEGHTGPVSACAWSPDSSRLLSGANDKTLRLWASANGRCLLTLEGHANEVLACAWSPDASQVLSGSLDNLLRVWDANTGRCLQILEGHSKWVLACAWSPDGSQVLSASDDGTLRIWDASSGRCLLTLERHPIALMSCEWSPNGSSLLSASYDNALRLWDTRAGRCSRVFEGHTNPIITCAWSPDGSRVLSGSRDKTLRVWDVGSGRCVNRLEGHSNGVLACAWSPDGSRLISGSLDRTLRVWESASGNCLRTLAGHSDSIRACAWSPDNSLLLSGSSDSALRVWEATSGRCHLILEGHRRGVRACAWSPDGMRVLSGSDDHTLRVWDAASGACIHTLEGHSGGVRACAWSRDGRRLLSTSYDGTLRVWDAMSGACLMTLEGHSTWVFACTWSPDGTHIASGALDGTCRIWRSTLVDGKETFIPTCSLLHLPNLQSAIIDLAAQRFAWVSPDAEPHLAWRYNDPNAQRVRLLPAEFFGPLPSDRIPTTPPQD